jgi:protein-tyrosine phosphatase
MRQMREQSRLLFLCSGNYSCSRFAEALFNALADEAGLRWRASSRGVAVGRGGNAGPISKHTLEGLAARGLPVEEPVRYPMQVGEYDLANADLVVALKEEEHRPVLQSRYAHWSDRVEYWHVDDLDAAVGQDALAELERNVKALVSRLSEPSEWA